jgi:hypothetical protein
MEHMLLASFVAGLVGFPGKQTIQFPDESRTGDIFGFKGTGSRNARKM